MNLKRTEDHSYSAKFICVYFILLPIQRWSFYSILKQWISSQYHVAFPKGIILAAQVSTVTAPHLISARLQTWCNEYATAAQCFATCMYTELTLDTDSFVTTWLQCQFLWNQVALHKCCRQFNQLPISVRFYNSFLQLTLKYCPRTQETLNLDWSNTLKHLKLNLQLLWLAFQSKFSFIFTGLPTAIVLANALANYFAQTLHTLWLWWIIS